MRLLHGFLGLIGSKTKRARFVRRFRPELPVLLMSGYADKAATGLEDSALPVLAKPFTQELLLEALHAAIA